MTKLKTLWGNHPNSTALQSHVGLKPITLSWPELYHLLHTLSHRLLTMGIGQNSQVLIHASSGQSELYTFLLLNSLSLIGCKVILPMNPLGKETTIWKKNLSWDVAFAPLQLDLYHCDAFQLPDDNSIKPIQLLETDLASYIETTLRTQNGLPPLPQVVRNIPEELFISTSGSSGKPKFLSYSWSSFIKSAKIWEKAHLFDEASMGGTGLTLLFAHTMGIRTWINALYNKNVFCLMDVDLFQSEATVAAYLLGQMKPQHITGGPALYAMLLELSRYVPQLNNELRSSLKTVVMSGAPWSPKIAERIKNAWDIHPINAFGTTETLQVIRQTEEGRGSANLGQPLPGVKLHLQESDSDLFQLGVTTPFSAVKCYYTDREPQLIESPYFTGDMVSQNSEGEIRFIHRKKRDFLKDAYGVKIQLSILKKRLPESEMGINLFEGMVDRPGLLLTVVYDKDQQEKQNIKVFSRWKKSAHSLNQNIDLDIDEKEAQHYRIFRVAFIKHPIPKTRKGGVNEFQLRLELKSFFSSATLSYFQSSNMVDIEEANDKQYLLNNLNPRYASMLRLLRIDEPIIGGHEDWIQFENREKEYLDCVGGFGVNLFGHNNQEIKDTAIAHLTSKSIPIADQGSFQVEAAVLSRNLQQALLQETGKEYRIFLTNSGAESVDLALRHAYLQWKQKLHRMKQRELFKIQKNCSDLASQFEKRWQASLSRYQPLILNLHKSFHGNLITEASISRNSDGSNPFSSIAPFAEFTIGNTSDICRYKTIESMELPSLQKSGDVWSIGIKQISRHIASIVEPVRGEGGILVQDDELLKHLGNLDAPLIADSIQCGFGRCGSLIGASAPFDTVLFGKALGGGVERIAAVAFAQDTYCQDLNKYATSTYGNGGLGAVVAQKSLEILQREKGAEKALLIGGRIEEMLIQFQKDFPNWIESISGKGLLWGIKLSFSNHQDDFFVRQIGETELGGYLLSSWLFHRCNIRILPTISAHQTLRIEPSIFFGDKEIAFLRDALYRLGELLNKKDWYELCLPLVHEDIWQKKCASMEDETEVISFTKEAPAHEARKVGFVVHFLHGEAELHHTVPSFRRFSKPARQMLFYHFMQLSEFKAFSLYARNIHKGKIWMSAKTLTIDVATLQGHLTTYQREKLLNELQNTVDELAREGCKFVSLGAFTSIISDNGLRLQEPDNCRILTGNTLTVTHSLHLLQQYLRPQSTLCVVGGTGNIGTALVRKLLQQGTHYQKVILFGRRAQLFKEELEQLIGSKNVNHVEYTSDFSRLREGDVIVGASSASETLIFPHHIKASKRVAILDIAVPSAVAETTYELPNVVPLVSHPGLEMPEDKDFQMSPILPPGVTYCCAAEAILCALHGINDGVINGSLRGRIDIEMIDILQSAAEEHGYFQQAIALENYEAISL